MKLRQSVKKQRDWKTEKSEKKKQKKTSKRCTEIRTIFNEWKFFLEKADLRFIELQNNERLMRSIVI